MERNRWFTFKLMEQAKFNLQEALEKKLRVEAATVTEGRTSLYNPLLQKPVSLEPVGPGSYPAGLGGYAYIGPPADFGGSYGCYEDTQGRTQYGIATSKQFSIYDGSPIALKAELSADERDALLTQLDEVSESYKCESCRAELLVSAFIQTEEIHCPYCSSNMSGAVEKVKQCYSKLEEKNMGTEKAQAVKAEADLAKEAMKVESPKEINEAIPDAKKAEMEDHKAADKEATMIKEADCGLEANPSEVKSEVEAAAKAKVEAAAKRRSRIEAAKKAYEAKKKEAALAALKKKKAAQAKVQAQAEAKKAASLKKELRIMATLEPAKFAEMKAKPALAAVCAEVEAKLYTKEQRAQVRAELAAMAEHDPEAAEMARKELEFVAPEILMEQDAAPVAEEAPMAEEMAAPADAEKIEQNAEETAEENKEEAGEGEKAEAMKTEFLASVKDLTCEKVEMSLHGETTENPFWNLTVDAEPVGRIYLQDQENHEQIRAGFMADSYAANLGQAMSQVGLEKMLTLTKARLFAHRMDDTEAMARVKAAAKLEAKAEFAEKLQTIRQDFVHAAQTAIMASEKNLYKNEAGHALKGGLFNALANLSIQPDYAVWAIEAGFESAPEYFDFITQKAIEIMDMPKEARDSFENIVKASGKMEIAASTQPEEESLRDRLVKASSNAVAMGGMVGGEDKDMVRQNLNLSPYRR